MSTKKRIFYLDELRMLAILAVMLCHIDNMYPYVTTSLKAAIPYFLTAFGRIGVPLFLMLSGALLLNRDYELGFFLKKRFSRILIPFIFWVIVIAIFQFTLLAVPMDETIKWMMGSGVTWYVYELIGAYLFLPVVNAFILKYGENAAKYFIVLWAVVLLFKTFHVYPISHLKLGYFAGFIGYMVFGHYLFTHKFNFTAGKMMILSIILFVAFYIINCANCFINDYFFDYMTIVLALQTAGIFLFFRYAEEYSNDNKTSVVGRIGNFIQGKFGKAITSISVCSYGMYFTHTVFYMVIKKFHFTSIKLIPVLFVILVVLSWAMAYICSRIPLLDKVSGVK